MKLTPRIGTGLRVPDWWRPSSRPRSVGGPLTDRLKKDLIKPEDQDFGCYSSEYNASREVTEVPAEEGSPLFSAAR